jgi:RHS repeat-associated protein
VPEQLDEQSEIYLALGRGEALIDNAGADDLLAELKKLNGRSQTTVLEAEHGLHDRLGFDAEEITQQKGNPPAPPVPLNPNRNVTAPKPVEGAPVTNESPAQQGAPDLVTPPENFIVLETTGQSDTPIVNRHVPCVYAYDRLNPIPANQVIDLVNPPPANAIDYNEMVRRTLTNAPMPNQPDPSARPVARKPATAGEPVDLFSGTFVINVCDLTVPTPHIPIAISRSYRSGKPYYGPFGYGWDHTYNVYLRELEGGTFALWTGELREVQFTVGGAGFETEAGFAARLEPLVGVTDVYDVQFPGGLAWRFERPAGWTDTERIPLTTITDRYGNQIRLRYNTINKVESVLDTAGRGLLFSYGSCDLLEAVSDHTTSRIARYLHDTEIEHLVGVILPATAQYPEGLQTTYDYDNYNPHPAMQHNILRIHDAEGRVTVENEFAGPEAGWEFNAVVRQRTMGFEYRFEYEQIQFVWPDPLNADVLASRTVVRPPDGSHHTYTFNYRGDLLDHRLRLNRDGSYRVISSQWEHDAEGNVTSTIGPDGLRTIFTFDSSNPDPCARRNLQRVELASPLPLIAPSRIVFQAQYDPRYQLIVGSKDETNAETLFKYDFDLAPFGATGRLAELRHPQVVLADGTLQQSTLSYEHNPQGQVTAAVTAEGVRTDFAFFGAGPRAGLLSTVVVDPGGANLVTELDYAATGFGTTITTPGARTTGFTYNGLGQLEAVFSPTIAGERAALRRWFDDSGAVVRVERPAGSYTGLLDGTAIVDEFERDEVGNVRRAALAANTIDRREWRQSLDHEGRTVAVWDPLGKRSCRRFAENGTLLGETHGTGDAAALETSYSYDRAGRVTRVVESSGAETRTEYDMWGRPHKVTLPSGAVRVLEYGPGDRLVEERAEELIGGILLVRQRRRFDYDRRGRLVAETVFSFRDDPSTAAPLTTSYVYDKDDRLREVLSPRGAQHTLDFDTAGRPSQETDVHGNVRQYGYDAAGDLVQIALIDQVSGATRTRIGNFTFDARKRLMRNDFLDSVATFEYDDRDLAVEQHLPKGVAKHLEFNSHGQTTASVIDRGGLALRSVYEYDLAGRVRSYIDPMTMATVWDRDALGRPSAMRMPDGTVWKYVVDPKGRTTSQQTPAGNVIQYQIVDPGGRLVRMTAAPAPGQGAVVPHEYTFDGLGRLVQAAAGADVVQRKYDSMDRVIEESARGRIVRMEYDDATGSEDVVYTDGRRERTEHNPAGQPTRIVLIAPGALGGTAGDVLLEILYSTSGLPDRMVYGNGVAAQMARDHHDRVIRLDYHIGGTLLDSCRLRYDDDGHHAVVQYLGAPSRNVVHDFDGDDRLIETRSGFALAALSDATTPAAQAADVLAARAAAAGAPGAAFVLDDADSRLQVVGLVTESYVSGNDHRVVTAGARFISYSPDGCRILDSRYSYELDALNRVTRVRNSGTTAILAEMAYDALSRVASGTTGGRPFERWFLGTDRLQESASGSGAERQHSAHPLWPGPFSVIDTAGAAYVHQDQGGSTMCVTDAGGAVVERHRYDTFGESAAFASDGVTPLAALKTEAMWRGMPALENTKLFHTPHRLYDPELGVFTSRDPELYADSPSPYAFAAHNPADFADPTGLAKTPVAEPTNPPAAQNQPSIGDRLLDGLGGIPGTPFALRKDVKTVVEMVKAFQAEKTLGGGVIMAVNVLNPLYHAEVARFESGEAADRGEYGKAADYGFQAVVGYVQTLGLATGLARGIVRPGPGLTPPPARPLTAPPVGAISVVVAEGKPVVRMPALNVEMNTGARAAPPPLADLPQAAPGSGTWATAEGVPPVRSGFGYPGYEGNLAVEVFEHANANGITLRPHGFFDRLPNLGAPGAWASTHAELKVVYRNPHIDFVEVNRAMCKGCRGSISQIVMQRGSPIVVLDPKGFWYFTPMGIFFPPGY